MPPPKAKLHKNTGRLKNINSTRVDSSSANRASQTTTTTNNSNNLNIASAANARATQNSNNVRSAVPAIQTNPTESPAIEQFELELYWCIQTLENSLGSGKLNAKQGKGKHMIWLLLLLLENMKCIFCQLPQNMSKLCRNADISMKSIATDLTLLFIQCCTFRRLTPKTIEFVLNRCKFSNLFLFRIINDNCRISKYWIQTLTSLTVKSQF